MPATSTRTAPTPSLTGSRVSSVETPTARQIVGSTTLKQPAIDRWLRSNDHREEASVPLRLVAFGSTTALLNQPPSSEFSVLS